VGLGIGHAHLISNAQSGHGAGATLAEMGKRLASEYGTSLVSYEIGGAETFEAQTKRALEAALGDGGVLIAAGGDGTIRGVAQWAQGTGVRFAVIPCGTFNFFARTHNIPEDLETRAPRRSEWSHFFNQRQPCPLRSSHS